MKIQVLSVPARSIAGDSMGKLFPFVLAGLVLFSCGPTAEEQLTYDQLVTEGWTLFQSAQYDSALSKFIQAGAIDPTGYEAYSGIGWSNLRLDQLSSAASSFQAGSTQFNADVSATLFAGWAFVLNAQKQYSNSNTRADQALGIDPNWIFEHGLSYDKDHVHVLKAENYFALGDYTLSLTAVKAVNPSFSADVTNSTGQAQLAAEIERLKTTL